MLRAIIIDDEQSGIDMLKLLVARNSKAIRIVASSLNPEEGIALIEDFRPDVVFLDISMPMMSGFELLARLDYTGFKLVFTTAHRDFAIEAIRSKAFDYLLKPIDDADFTKCVSELVNECSKTKPLTAEKQALLEVLAKDGISYIRPQEIIRLEASRSYTVFHLDGGIRHVASKSLKEFESKLSTDLFYRCHNSHIINLRKVRKFVNHMGYFALMNDGSMADISKKCKEPFLERLKSL
jgi:two-component system LytT family response regulator